jgi:hypothetical protein
MKISTLLQPLLNFNLWWIKHFILLRRFKFLCKNSFISNRSHKNHPPIILNKNNLSNGFHFISKNEPKAQKHLSSGKREELEVLGTSRLLGCWLYTPCYLVWRSLTKLCFCTCIDYIFRVSLPYTIFLGEKLESICTFWFKKVYYV